MKITAQEEYGLRCIVQLASMPVGEPLAGSERRHLGMVVLVQPFQNALHLGYPSPAQFEQRASAGQHALAA